jgi:hypothetical protein
MAPTSLFLNLLFFNLRIIITIKWASIPIVVEGIGHCSRSLMKIYYSRFLTWRFVIEKIACFSRHLLKTYYCYKILLWTCWRNLEFKIPIPFLYLHCNTKCRRALNLLTLFTLVIIIVGVVCLKWFLACCWRVQKNSKCPSWTSWARRKIATKWKYNGREGNWMTMGGNVEGK